MIFTAVVQGNDVEVFAGAHLVIGSVLWTRAAVEETTLGTLLGEITQFLWGLFHE